MDTAIFRDNLQALTQQNPKLAALLPAVTTVSPWLEASVENAKAYWHGAELRNPVVCLWLGVNPYLFGHWIGLQNPITQVNWILEHRLEPLQTLLEHVPLADRIAAGNVRLLYLNGNPTLADEFRAGQSENLAYSAVLATHLLQDSESYQEQPELYREAVKAYGASAFGLLQFCGNSPEDSYVGLDNMLRNIENLAKNPGVKELYGALEGVPAVIVATGPSLTEEVLPFLRAMQGRAVIFSVDASLKWLQTHGIAPNFVCTLERVPETLPFFENLTTGQCGASWLISFPVVVPEVYKTYPGPHLILFRRFSHFAPLLGFDQGTLDAGPSSANMAFVLAKKFGCSAVSLVGCDFSYSPAGHTHSEAAYWGTTAEVELSLARYPVPGVLDRDVETNATWDGFRLQLQRDIETYGGPVYNLGTGAKIHGTIALNVAALLDPSLAFLPEQTVQITQRIEGRIEKWSVYPNLAWLWEWRDERLPEIVECLDNACEDVEAHLRESRSLVGDVESTRLNAHFQSLFEWYSVLFGPGLLYNAAAHIVQSEWIRAMVEHHHAPFVAETDEQVASARILLHRHCLERLLAMFKRLLTLYTRELTHGNAHTQQEVDQRTPDEST